jgi:hypothetical protein
MTNEEKNLIEELMRKSITKEEFQKQFSMDLNEVFLLQRLERAYEQNNADDLEYVMFVGFAFDLYSEKMANILSQLLIQDWHHVHEDLASVLQDLKDPQSIDNLYQTALANYEYLDFDDSYALAVKCIWALGDINTEYAREKLKLLAKSNNSIIKENAVNQLNRNH